MKIHQRPDISQDTLTRDQTTDQFHHEHYAKTLW